MTKQKRRFVSLAISAGCCVAAAVPSAGRGQSAASHVVLTNQQDRQRMMDELKITMFPSGPGAYLASTYDENTANPYPTLPDPLLMNDGTRVTSAAQWPARRAEIKELFDREVYGRRPIQIPSVKWIVASTTETTTGNTTMVTKQLVGRVDNSSHPSLDVTILATLSTPKEAGGPVPVVLMFGGGGSAPEGTPSTTPCLLPGQSPPNGRGRAGGTLAARGGAPAARGGVAGAAPAPRRHPALRNKSSHADGALRACQLAAFRPTTGRVSRAASSA